jgi:RNA polymerase sigma factor (sigma-70 family)
VADERVLRTEERASLERMAACDRGGDQVLRRDLGMRAAGAPAGRFAGYLDALLARTEAVGAEVDRLAAAAAAGDGRARERLIEALLPRVVGLARRFAGHGAEFADLVQEGVLAMLEALVRFAPDQGTPFWAYARPWVHGSLYRLAHDQRRAVRLPPRALADLAALKEAARRIDRPTSEPTVRTLAERAGIHPDRAEALTRAARPPRSLEEPADQDGDLAALRDVLPDPDASSAYDEVVAQASEPALAALLGALTDREREVIERRFGLGGQQEETLVTVGERLGVTRERVRQIEARALGKLRQAV